MISRSCSHAHNRRETHGFPEAEGSAGEDAPGAFLSASITHFTHLRREVVVWQGVIVWALAMTLLMAIPGGVAGQASYLTPLGGQPSSDEQPEYLLSDRDDSYGSVPVTNVFPDGINFGGTFYTQIYISTNGYITFGHGNRGYSPQGIAAYTLGPIVAPQYDDLDPEKGGTIHYDQNPGGNYVLVTFDRVAPFSTPHDGSGLNTYQVVLRTLPGGASTDFQIELRYIDLQWARSGNNSAWPTAGWSAGDQVTYSELAQSGRSDFRDIQFGSNVGSTGVYRWNVEGGVVQSTPTVSATDAPSAVGATQATSGGLVSSDGGSSVTSRGLVYHTTQTPSLSHNSVTSGSGTGSFTATLTGLTPSTTYYVRAFATNSLGTAYGPERSFTTQSVAPPTVTTGPVVPGTTTAEGGGNVTSDGGAPPVTARGLAWGTSSDPTTAGNSVSAGTGTGSFSAQVTGLDPGTTYHLRAWATNSEGTSYGSNVSFTTERLSQTLTFPELSSRRYGGAPFELEATASSGLTVSYASSDPSVATASGSTVTIVGVGTTTITASQDGNSTYQPASPVERALTVGPRELTVNFTVPEYKVYDGATDAEVLDRSLTGVLPADQGQVQIVGGEAHYDTPEPGEGKTVTLTGAALTGDRAHLYEMGGTPTTTADIRSGSPDRITLSGPARVMAGEVSDEVRIQVVDRFGNPTPVEEDTRFRLATSAGMDSATFLPEASVTVLAGESVVLFRYSNTLVGTGEHVVGAEWVSGTRLDRIPSAHHPIQVRSGELRSFRVEAVGVGDFRVQETDSVFSLRAVALDRHGNVATNFRGRVDVSSNGELSLGAGESASFQAGILESHAVAFGTAGDFTLTVTGQAGLPRPTGTSQEISVRVPAPSIQLSMEASDPNPSLGDEITLRIILRNVGRGPAYDMEIPDPLEGQDHRLELLEAESGAAYFDETSGHWKIDRLGPGEQIDLELRVRVLQP